MGLSNRFFKLKFINVLVPLTDMLILLVGFYLFPDFAHTFENESLFSSLFFYAFLFCGVNQVRGVYYNYNNLSFPAIIRRTMEAYLIFIILIFFIYWRITAHSHSFQLQWSNYIFMLIYLPVCILASRVLFVIVRKRILKEVVTGKQKILVIGDSKLVKMINNQLNIKELKTYEIVGYFTDKKPQVPNELYLGSIESILQSPKLQEVDNVVCSMGLMEKNKFLKEFIKQADNMMLKVHFVVNNFVYTNKELSIDYLNRLPVFSLRNEPLAREKNAIVKRVFDIMLSSFVIVFILSWMVPLIGILIKLESKGPVFFKQKRNGYNNQVFDCFKFRSMRVNAESDSKQASKNDNRVTKIGAFLRKTSLDEFPQFFNVFLGQMSVVGPRPHMVSHTVFYSKAVDKYMVRHFVMPGITGWAQVNGSRGETKHKEDMQRRVEHDIWYLENWSFWLDLKIVFQTFLQVFKSTPQAY